MNDDATPLTLIEMTDRSLALVEPAQPSTTPSAEERREFHRIRYPIAERPTFSPEGKKAHSVLDIAEHGIRYLSPDGHPLPRLHDSINGVLRFRDGVRINLEGIVLRVQDQEVVLYFVREIPLNILLAEQRRLHKKYPMWS